MFLIYDIIYRPRRPNHTAGFPYPTPPHRRSRIWAGDMAKTPGKFFTTGKPSKGPPRLPFGLRTKDNNRYDRKEISDQQ